MAERFFTQKTVTKYKQWYYGQNQIYRNSFPTVVNNLAAQTKNSLPDPRLALLRSFLKQLKLLEVYSFV